MVSAESEPGANVNSALIASSSSNGVQAKQSDSKGEQLCRVVLLDGASLEVAIDVSCISTSLMFFNLIRSQK